MIRENENFWAVCNKDGDVWFEDSSSRSYIFASRSVARAVAKELTARYGETHSVQKVEAQ